MVVALLEAATQWWSIKMCLASGEHHERIDLLKTPIDYHAQSPLELNESCANFQLLDSILSLLHPSSAFIPPPSLTHRHPQSMQRHECAQAPVSPPHTLPPSSNDETIAAPAAILLEAAQ